LTVPTDPRFDLSSAAGDRLNSFGAAFDPFHTGSNDIFLLVLYAENIPTVGSTSDQNYTYWYTDNGDLELSARLAYAIDEGATAGGQTVGTPVSVPEPPILWLFGIGLAILVLIKRRSIRPVHIRPLRLLPVFSASI
jgi:hypothetical protein